MECDDVEIDELNDTEFLLSPSMQRCEACFALVIS